MGRGWVASLASQTYVPRACTRKNTSGSCDTKGRSVQIFLLIICFSLYSYIYSVARLLYKEIGMRRLLC